MRRSKRGRIRLLILSIIAIIFLAIIIFLIGKGYGRIKEIISESGNLSSVTATPLPVTTEPVAQITPIATATPKITATATPTMRVTATGTPTAHVTATPFVTATPEMSPTPTPEFKAPFIDAEKIQYEILKYVLYTSQGVKCKATDGSEYVLGFDGFKIALIDKAEVDKCRPIELADVKCGDVAYTEKALGVCVGFDEGHPIFAYCCDNNISKQMYGEDFGMFVGYALCDSAELYCGCYPLPAIDFYDCAYGEGNNDFYLGLKNKYFLEYDHEHFNAMNGFAVAMQTGDVERFSELFYEDELDTYSLKWGKGYPQSFFSGFLSKVGASELSRYSFYPTGRVEHEDERGKFYDYICEISSLDAASFSEVSGNCNITVCELNDGTLKIMPHTWMVSIREKMRDFGLEIDNDGGAVDEQGEQGEQGKQGEQGEQSSVNQDKQYGVVVTDESGNRSVDITSEVTIELGEDKGDVALGFDVGSVMDMYEKTNFIVNRDLGAIYRGTFMKDEDGNVDRLEEGVWVSVFDQSEVGFVTPIITDLYYEYDEELQAYICYRDRVKEEYYDEFKTGFLYDNLFMIIDGVRYEGIFVDGEEPGKKKSILWVFRHLPINYEVRNINGVLYIVSDNLEEYSPGRTVEFNGVKGICYRLIPPGAKRGQNYLFEISRLHVNPNDCSDYTFEYEYYCSNVDAEEVDEMTTSSSEQYIWKRYSK